MVTIGEVGIMELRMSARQSATSRLGAQARAGVTSTQASYPRATKGGADMSPAPLRLHTGQTRFLECPRTVVAGPVQWCVALVVGEQGPQDTHAATGGRQVDGGAAQDVSDTHTGPVLQEGLHALLLVMGEEPWCSSIETHSWWPLEQARLRGVRPSGLQTSTSSKDDKSTSKAPQCPW
ncbi:hypothetical protein EYF80_027443 [Liparis tanakae]|uniref:Uncharacterized protein n=1 Tax=Liparis tanakae TaxID=230148 RepID=A0A4Z2H976_9TELE|nr:hypothetical protein EYF80_027443 [Liparis tanakae]